MPTWTRDRSAPGYLYLCTDDRALLGEWARSGYPEEVCGVLIGAPARGGTRVHAVRHGINLERDRPHERFLLDARTLLEADRDAAAAGLEIVGVWHSHPDHPARPSVIDRRHAFSGWSWVIVSVNGQGCVEIRSWRLEGDTFLEESLAGS